MSDQPPDPTNHVAGDRPTTDDGHDQPAADQATTPALLTLDDAAAELGITVNAVRQRIKRGTLLGVKTDEGWLVDPGHRPANHTTIPTDQQPTIDLAPLAEVIRDQNRRLEELSASTAFWQVRALQAEDRLKQLASGEIVPQTIPKPPGSTETSDISLRGLWDRLCRLWSGKGR